MAYTFLNTDFKPMTNEFGYTDATQLGNNTIGDQEKQMSDAIDPATQTQIDYVRAQQIANSIDTPKDKYVSKTLGFQYDKAPEESQWDDVATSVLAYAQGYLQNGRPEDGLINSFNAIKQKQGIVQRHKNIEYLEQQGYNPVDIQQYVNNGDPKALVQNLEQWKAVGNNIYNPRTGEFRNATGTSEDLYNVTLPDGTVVQAKAKDVLDYYKTSGKDNAITPYQQGQLDLAQQRLNLARNTAESKQAAANTPIGSIGDTDNEGNPLHPTGLYTDAQGQLHQGFITGNKWSTKAPTSAQAKAYNNAKMLDTIDPSTDRAFDSVNSIISMVDNKAPVIGKVTGRFFNATMSPSFDPSTSGLFNSDKDIKEYTQVKQMLKQLDAQIGLQGSAMAKLNGISGINTLSEFQRYKDAVGGVDYSSPEALKASLENIKTSYSSLLEAAKNKLRSEANIGNIPVIGNTANVDNSSSQVTGSDYSRNYGEEPTSAPAPAVKASSSSSVPSYAQYLKNRG